MSGNQKQAPTVMPQSHTRYTPQGPYSQRPPTPGRADQFHVASQPYVQQQPQNQTSNQGPGQNLRGMAPTVPPTQASTPPNADMNKVQQMQQQASVNIGYMRQPSAAYYRAPQPNQSTRMAQSHRQPNTVFQGTQQQLYSQQTAQAPFMQIPMQSMIINPALYQSQINPNGNQQPRYIAPNNIPYFNVNQPYVHYAPPQQPQIYYTPQYAQLQRTAHPAQVAQPQHVTGLGQQPQPQQIPTAAYAPAAVQMQQTAPAPRKNKQRSHAIAIIDPNTGKQIEDTNSEQNESSSHPASGESSARQTPQPGTIQRDIKQEVQAEFAKRVAQTIHDDDMRVGVPDDQHLQQVVLTPPQQQPQIYQHQQQQQGHMTLHLIGHQQPADSHHPTPFQLQQQQQVPQAAAPQYLPHGSAQAHSGIPAQQMQPVEQQIYTPQYTSQEFMPRQQQLQQEAPVVRPQQVLGSSSKYQQVGGDKESYEPINETPVVSAKQGEEVTIITSSNKHSQRMDNMAKIIVAKKHREEPAAPIIVAPPPFEEQQPAADQRIEESVIEDSEPSVSATPTEQRDAKITVSSSSSKEAPVEAKVVIASSGKQAATPVKEAAVAVVNVVVDQQSSQTLAQQQYRDSTSTATTTSSSNVSSSTTINNNKISIKKDDKPVTEVPVSTAKEQTEFSVVQAQDNAKSKQGSQRTNKDVSKQQQAQPAPQQQVVPPKPQPQPQMAAPTAKVTVPVPQTQPSKPTSKTQKHKDLNTKGATKEGTDMDVFNDITTTAPPNQVTDDKQSSVTSNSKPDVVVPVKEQVEEVPAQPPPTVSVINSNATTNATVPIISSTTNVVVEPKKLEPTPTIKSIPKTNYDVCAIVKETPKPFVAPAPAPATQIESKDQTDRCEVIVDNQLQSKNDTNKAPGDANNDDDNKITYEKDQWAPNNITGKKQYGKEFLLAISSRPKCKEVPDIDTVICREILKDGENKTHIGDNLNRSYGSSRSGGDFSNWTGGKSASQKGLSSTHSTHKVRHGSQHKAGGGGGGGGGKGSKIGGPMVSISVKGDVKLHECENAWKPMMRNKAPAPASEVDTTDDDPKTEELYRKVRGILNKLTPQKFETLLKQVQKLVIDTETRLSVVIDLVFEKAVDEPNFSVAYASLCSHLSTLQVAVGADSKASNNKEKHVNFRKLLLTRCQTEFESNSRNEEERNNKMVDIEECADPEKKKELLAHLEEETRKIRRKSVGNIRFIGELFKKGMLTPNIMNNCLSNLLQDRHEDSLECLCKLLTTIGKELENSKERGNMNTTFNTMKEIVHKKNAQNVSSRVRFMLQDVIELRASNWVPRRQDFNPKTMDQIQKEADNEQMDIQVMNSMPPPTRNSGPPQDRNNRRGGGGGGGGGGTGRNLNDDGWSPVTNRNNRPPAFSVQPDKLKIKPQEGSERLGSMQQFNTWGRGSGGTDIKMTNATNPVMGSATRNMYAALQTADNAPESFNRLNRDPYSSKGHSLEKYGKQYDGPSSRSGSQHRNQPNQSHHGDMSDPRPHGGGHSMSLHMPTSTSGPSLRPQPPMQSNQQHHTPVAPVHQAPAPLAVAQAPVLDTPPVPAIVVKYPTDDDDIYKLERRLNNIVDEYNGELCAVDDVAKELNELLPKDYYNRFVSRGMLHVLEKTQIFRQKTGALMGKLILSQKLSLDQYCIGLEEVLSLSPELEIDIPKLWESLADLIVPAICLEALPLNRLPSVSKELTSTDLAHKMLTPLCMQIIRIKGPDFLQNAWRSSGISLANFMPAAQVDNFVLSNNLQILVGGTQLPKINNALTFETIRVMFLEFFVKNASFDEICNWITANIGNRVNERYFIRPFFTAILEHSIITAEEARKTKKFRSDIFDKHTNLIQRFISCDLDAQVQCLYATQTLINLLEHPQGLLLSIFDKLDESSSITPEAVYRWEKCEDPTENLGKGVCLKQLSAFINSMKEGDESSEEA